MIRTVPFGSTVPREPWDGMEAALSVQKLVAEADKLFEKGKTPEGIAKLKAAISEEPLNQIVVTKLAGVLIQERQPLEAAKVYGGLAKRLSEAGKSQVAIAIFKQALELAPDDISLRMRFAQECESIGKLGDAFLQGQIVLNFYLRRKRYFDASNILPLMARSQPKDDKIKLAWIEVLQLCQAEQKLVHLLVALCGPPGIVSPEFPQGGDPVTLTPALYEGLKRLVPFFPRDPKVAYAVAWCAYRRGLTKEFYHYLHECLRREPDFCLAILLFSRALSEEKRLNEALFVYRYYKERMTADKNADMLTLNRLMEAFVEKNGWIKFIEDSGEVLDTPGFFKVMTGQEQKVSEEEKAAQEAKEEQSKADEVRELPPAEIELGGGAPSNDLEIVTATGQSIADVKTKKPLAKDLSDPMRMQAELIKATIEATVAGMGGTAATTQQTVVQPVVLPVIQAAAVQGAPAAPVSAETIAQATAAAAKSVESGIIATPAEAAEPLTPSAPPAPPAVETKAPEPPKAPPAPEASYEPEREEPTGEVEGFKGESVEFTSLIRRDQLDELRAEEPAPAGAEPEPPSEDSGATRVAVQQPAAEKTIVATAEPADQTVVAPPSGGDATVMQPLTADSTGEGAEPASGEIIFSGKGAAPAPAAEEADDGEEEDEDEEDEKPSKAKKKTFNPFDAVLAPEDGAASLRLEEEADERTQMFSPIEVLDAAKIMQNRDLGDVGTKEILTDGKIRVLAKDKTKVPPPPAPETAETPEGEKSRWRNLRVDGEKTVGFSPVEAVQAGVNSRRPHDAMVKAAEPKPEEPAPEGDFTSGEATVILKRPEGLPTGEPAPVEGEAAAAKESTGKAAVDPNAEEASASNEVEISAASGAEDAPAKEGAFRPIPSAAESERPGAGEDKVDLGDDLLEGPTRIFTQPSAADKTEHLIKEIKADLKNKVSERLNIDMLMKKAERYTAKRNYYLARKALRHAQALGADEEVVKAKLREIRKLELPDGLYNTISSDQTEKKVDTASVLEQLEQEFELNEGNEADELAGLVSLRIEEIFRGTDARTILDFGVGLHEMGLFRQAEALFIRLVEEFPDHAFDAYYLAAISKLSRRDYAGAASILKRLSSDTAKTDLEKIQIYYALGETFAKMRQRERSRKFFKKVAELDANYRNIRHKLGE